MEIQPVPPGLEEVLAAQWQADLAASFEPSLAMENMIRLLGMPDEVPGGGPGEWGRWLPSTRSDLARYVAARRAAGADVAQADVDDGGSN